MSALAKAARAPKITTTTAVEVELDPDELMDAGWVYFGRDARNAAAALRLKDLVGENHRDEHDGPMIWCRHALCMAVTR